MAPLAHDYGPANLDDWLTATSKNYLDEGQAQDQVYNYMALIYWLKKQGKTRVLDGGAEITHQLRYAKMAGGKWYAGAEVLSTQGTETLTEAGWKWRQCAEPVVITGLEKRANKSTRYRLLPLLQERTENAVEAVKDMLATSACASTQATNQPDALETLIGTTSSTGGFSGTSYSWWQATVTASGSMAGQGLGDLMATYMAVRKGPDAIDLIYSDQNIYQYYWQVLQPQDRYVDTKTYDAGFENLRFMGATWLSDTYPISGRIYMINSKSGLRFSAMDGANVDLNEEVRPANQDAWVRQVLLQCNFSTPQRRRNGKLTGVTQ